LELLVITFGRECSIALAYIYPVLEIRVCVMLGALPVWLVAMVSAFRGNRVAVIPVLHELAVKLALHVGHNKELA
jgi:uncharacterized membrane protein